MRIHAPSWGYIFQVSATPTPRIIHLMMDVDFLSTSSSAAWPGGDNGFDHHSMSSTHWKSIALLDEYYMVEYCTAHCVRVTTRGQRDACRCLRFRSSMMQPVPPRSHNVESTWLRCCYGYIKVASDKTTAKQTLPLYSLTVR